MPCAASGPMTLAELDPSAQAPCTSTTLTFSRGIGSLLAQRDQLIGNVVQVGTNDPRLRADSQHVVAHPLDKRSLPARGDGAESVPCVARDKTELRRLDPELLLDMGVGPRRGLVFFNFVPIESAPEKSKP